MRSGLSFLLLYGVLALTPATGQTPEPHYVDSAVCATCHPKQAASYRLTGMGRSFSPVTRIEDFTRGLPYYHAPSATYYSIAERNGEYFETQYQNGLDGKPADFSEKRIDYVLGSGNHARTYLSRTPRNALIELPLAWYAEKGGYWALNPGYDTPDQDGFTRHITADCMFCHNAVPGSWQPAGDDPAWPASLPAGIDCQRCHGPGSAHIERSGRGGIVNPAKLPRERAMEVCLQCHLETTSSSLPNAIRRFERGPFSFRPGEPLLAFRLDFDRPGDRFEIAGAGYQLDQSACMRQSQGKLSCTTCHDPHDAQHGSTAAARYNTICRNCHAAKISTSAPHTVSADCVSCHMPKRRTDDAVHVVMTDHRIARRYPANLLTDIPESRHTYAGEVLPYRAANAKPGDELYFAMAQVIDGSNRQAGIPRLTAAIAKFQPPAGSYYSTLADAHRDSGDCQKAIPLYEDALRRTRSSSVTLNLARCLTATGDYAKAEAALRPFPDDPKLLSQLGLVLSKQGKSSDAIAALTKATTLDPDLSEAWNDLGEIYREQRDPARAEAALRSALTARPNSADIHNNLADLLAATNRFDEAKFHFEAALHLRPADALFHHHYALALARTRRFPEAQAQLEQSIAAKSDDADVHHALGLVFESEGDRERAIAEYTTAVQLRPAFPLANLSLGFALIRSGRQAEAIPYLEQARDNSQGPIRDQAQRLIDQIRRP